LLTARRWTQQYEWNAHQPLALKGGLKGEIVDAVAAGRRPERMAGDEEAVYSVLDELFRNQSVSDPTYAHALTALGEHGLIAAIAVRGQSTLPAMVLTTARTPLPEGAKPALAPFPR